MRTGDNGYLNFSIKCSNDICIHKCIRNTDARNTNLSIFSPVEDYNLLKLKTEIRMGKGHTEPSFLCKERREKSLVSTQVW